MATLGGIDIFGDQVKQVGPTRKYRAMRRFLPGVSGFRVYRMGGDSYVIQVSGRITGTSRANLEAKIATALAMIDGQLRTYVGDGASYTNCLLDTYEPGPVSRVTTGGSVTYTCRVSATLSQSA